MKHRLHLYSLFISFFLLLASGCAPTTYTVSSWNIAHFGRTKTQQDMEFIAETIKDFDILTIQEVVGKYGGVKAVARLKRTLNENTTGEWEAEVSPITTGSPYQSERYAFIWNAKKVSIIDKGWLHPNYEKQIVREPFLGTFVHKKDTFTLVSFHAVPKKRQPEKEIKYLKYFPQQYPHLRLLFMGDFNTPQSNNVFNPLKKKGYLPSFVGQKTTLRMKCIQGDCLASEYDNIFYQQAEIKKIKAHIVPFYQSFPDMKAARKLSDHVPIVLTFKLK